MVMTTDEIARRVEETDLARSAKRAALAQHVGELARRRAHIIEDLTSIDRELGEVLDECLGVLGLTELAGFTDVPESELSRLQTEHKPTRGRGRRKRGDTRNHRTTPTPRTKDATGTSATTAPSTSPPEGDYPAPASKPATPADVSNRAESSVAGKSVSHGGPEATDADATRAGGADTGQRR
ncbi:hypothetical protein [Sciscionella marina]|uniref:hypothetical protein n=1 Tax=Sciscionella marina TaxID=508770 RepID=UPI00036578BD|nr:hypothetical protein [Sciscionella marina]